MLKTRILTALVFGPLLLASIFVPGPFGFSLIFAAIMIYGGWEFTRLCNLQSAAARGGYTLVLAITIIGGVIMLHNAGVSTLEQPVERVLMLVAVVALWGFSRFFSAGPGPITTAWMVTSALQGAILISGAWLALSWLRLQPLGSWWILQLLLIIWVADVGAYFTGRALGKRKLAPRISPGKTWAGVGGALLTAPLAALACERLSPLPTANLYFTIGLALVTVVASIGGDLLISLHKRATGVKDSGRIFPGHGGVLDRFDSLITGSVFYVLGHALLGTQ